MMYFATRLTVYVACFIGGVTVLITGYHNFGGISEFHGGWMGFLTYLLEGIVDCLYKFLISFSISGIVCYPIIIVVEKSMLKFYFKEQQRIMEKRRKKEEEQKKREEMS